MPAGPKPGRAALIDLAIAGDSPDAALRSPDCSGARCCALASMAPINHHFAPLPELPPLPPGFVLPPDVFALFYQGQVQDENAAKRPRLM